MIICIKDKGQTHKSSSRQKSKPGISPKFKHLQKEKARSKTQVPRKQSNVWFGGYRTGHKTKRQTLETHVT